MKRINQLISSLEFGKGRPSPFSKEQIFNSFKQGRVRLPFPLGLGGGGNCASVALVKTAIATFGFEGIFNSIVIDERNERYLIDLKDNEERTYSLYFVDYEFGAEKSSFELIGTDEISKDIFEFARFCFATMAEIKRCEYRHNKKYNRALNDLNKGELADNIHEYLGVKATNLDDVSIKNLSIQKNLLLWNGPHAVYSSEGFYDEFFDNVDGKKLEGIQPLSMLQIVHGDGTDKDAPRGAQILS